MTSERRWTSVLSVLCIVGVLAVAMQLAKHEAPNVRPVRWITALLRPLSMTIDYPDNWYYRENHLAPVLYWLVTQEPIATTAPRVSINVMSLTDVSRYRGHPVAVEVAQWIDAYRSNSAGAEVSRCSADNYTLFQHECLERDITLPVAGQPVLMHERSVLLWIDEADALAIVQARAPVEEWAAQEAILLRIQSSIILQ